MTARLRVEARPVAGPEQQGSSRSGDAAALGGGWRPLPSRFRLPARPRPLEGRQAQLQNPVRSNLRLLPRVGSLRVQVFHSGKARDGRPAASTASYLRISPVSASRVNARRSTCRASCALGSGLPGSAICNSSSFDPVSGSAFDCQGAVTSTDVHVGVRLNPPRRHIALRFVWLWRQTSRQRPNRTRRFRRQSAWRATLMKYWNCGAWRLSVFLPA